MRAILIRGFLCGSAGETPERFGIGELGREAGSLSELQIKGDRIIRGNVYHIEILDIVSLKGVSSLSNAAGVMAGVESRSRKAIHALLIRENAGLYGRARISCADQHAFHTAPFRMREIGLTYKSKLRRD